MISSRGIPCDRSATARSWQRLPMRPYPADDDLLLAEPRQAEARPPRALTRGGGLHLRGSRRRRWARPSCRRPRHRRRPAVFPPRTARGSAGSWWWAGVLAWGGSGRGGVGVGGGGARWGVLGGGGAPVVGGATGSATGGAVATVGAAWTAGRVTRLGTRTVNVVCARPTRGASTSTSRLWPPGASPRKGSRAAPECTTLRSST